MQDLYEPLLKRLDLLSKGNHWDEYKYWVDFIHSEQGDTVSITSLYITYYFIYKHDYVKTIALCDKILNKVDSLDKIIEFKTLALFSLLKTSTSDDKLSGIPNKTNYDDPAFNVNLTKLLDHHKKYPTHKNTYNMIILIYHLVNHIPELHEFVNTHGSVFDKHYFKIMVSKESVAAVNVGRFRESYYEGLLRLYDYVNTIDVSTIDAERLRKYSLTQFYLSYQGHSNKEMYRLICMINRRIMPDLTYTSPHISTKRREGRIRIGFISKMISKMSSVFKDRGLVITNLHRAIFEKYIIISDEPADPMVKNMCKHADHVIIVKEDNSIVDIRKQLSKLELDILVYCDIGMYNLFYYLAYSRLAKIQINTWGHSDTSGIDTIDYFISSKLYEIDNIGTYTPYEYTINRDPTCVSTLIKCAQDNYTEKLIALDSMCTVYAPPVNESVMQKFIKDYRSSSLYLPPNATIFISPHSTFKYTESYLTTIGKILEHDPSYRVIFIKGQYEKESSALYDKCIKCMGDRVNQVIIRNRLHFGDMQRLMYNCDVILDSFPFGGCNVSLEAFNLNKPIVTIPTNNINGRFTYGFYKKMGLEYMACHTVDEYITRAIDMATHTQKYITEISLNKSKLYLEAASQRDWTNMLVNMYKSNTLLDNIK